MSLQAAVLLSARLPTALLPPASKTRPKRGANKYFYHNDHLGGVNVITDIAGTRVQLNEYDPWGGISRTVGSIDPTHRFTGKELDPESGLYYYGGRYYDPEISRFISPDPFIQGPDNPQALNRYSYVLNNPQNYIDPTGHFFSKLFKSIFKSIFRVVFPVHAFANAVHSKVMEFTPPKVNAIFNILAGAGLLAQGHPAGLFLIAAGATAFGQSDGWQIASGIFGLASMAAAGGAFGGLGGGGFGNADPLFAGAVAGFDTGGRSNAVVLAMGGAAAVYDGIRQIADREDVPPLVYRFGYVNNPSHARSFRELFNPTEHNLKHLISPSGHRQSLAPQWGVEARINPENVAKLESALRAHVNNPGTAVIYGTSAAQRMTAIHFYNSVTGRVVSINPVTGALRSPTGFTVSPQQADSLTNSFHLGTR